jgi:hypothetical protein
MHRGPIRQASWFSAFAGIVALLLAGIALAGDQAPDMQAMMAAAQPGPHHEALVARAGTWKTTSRTWMAPDQEPMQSSGTSTMTAVLGGRFVEEVIQAPMFGQAWEGRGVFGYDNSSNKHIGTWYDSFGTMIMSFEGTCENHCRKVTLSSTFFDPATQSMQKMKSVSEAISDDESMTTLYMVADGNDIKTMEIHYERTGK